MLLNPHGIQTQTYKISIAGTAWRCWVEGVALRFSILLRVLQEL